MSSSSSPSLPSWVWRQLGAWVSHGHAPSLERRTIDLLRATEWVRPSKLVPRLYRGITFTVGELYELEDSESELPALLKRGTSPNIHFHTETSWTPDRSVAIQFAEGRVYGPSANWQWDEPKPPVVGALLRIDFASVEEMRKAILVDFACLDVTEVRLGHLQETHAISREEAQEMHAQDKTKESGTFAVVEGEKEVILNGDRDYTCKVERLERLHTGERLDSLPHWEEVQWDGEDSGEEDEEEDEEEEENE